MKKIPMKFVLVFIIALAFCSEDKKYSLIRNIENLPEVGAKWKIHEVDELYFDLPGRGRYQAAGAQCVSHEITRRTGRPCVSWYTYFERCYE